MQKTPNFIYTNITKVLVSVFFVLFVQQVCVAKDFIFCDPGEAAIKKDPGNPHPQGYECVKCEEAYKKTNSAYTDYVCPGVEHEYNKNAQWAKQPYTVGFYSCAQDNIEVCLRGFGDTELKCDLSSVKLWYGDEHEQINTYLASSDYELVTDSKHSNCFVGKVYCSEGRRVDFDNKYPKCIDCIFPGPYRCDDKGNYFYAHWPKNEIQEDYDKRQKCSEGLEVKKLGGKCEGKADTTSSSEQTTTETTEPEFFYGKVNTSGLVGMGKATCDAGQVWDNGKCVSCTSKSEWVNYANENRMYCAGVKNISVIGLQLQDQLTKCPAGMWPTDGLKDCECGYGLTKKFGKCVGSLSYDDMYYGPHGKNAPLFKQCWTKSYDSKAYKKCMGFDN